MITGSCFYNYSRDDYYGGAIYSRYSRITIIKSNFSDNKQTLNVQDHSLIISECTFINNTPGYSGRPAVYISGGQSVIISEATFINNTLEYVTLHEKTKHIALKMIFELRRPLPTATFELVFQQI